MVLQCCQALIGSVCMENEPPRCIVPRILFLDNYFYCKDKSNWDWPSGARMHVIGTLILQSVFRLPIVRLFFHLSLKLSPNSHFNNIFQFIYRSLFMPLSQV